MVILQPRANDRGARDLQITQVKKISTLLINQLAKKVCPLCSAAAHRTILIHNLIKRFILHLSCVLHRDKVTSLQKTLSDGTPLFT